MFFSFIFASLLKILTDILSDNASHSVRLTLVLRSCRLATISWVLITIIYLAYVHYRHLMRTSKDLRFINVAFFFCFGVGLFGLVYEDLYFLYPSSFNYPDALVAPGPNMEHVQFPTSYLASFDFILYSACTAVAVADPRISSASAVVSFLNFLQVLGTLLISALLIATFVQQSVTPPIDGTNDRTDGKPQKP